MPVPGDETAGVAPSSNGAGSAAAARRNGHDAHQPSVGDAAEGVAEAVRDVVLDHLALVLLEVRLLGRSLVRSTALVLVGALFLAATWGLAMGTLYAAIGDPVAPWARLGVVTLATGLVGGALVVGGARRLRRPAP